MHHQVLAGKSYPLGATPDVDGTNFALFSANATQIDLCLFDPHDQREYQRISLPEYSDSIWHGYVEGIKPGTLYGYRASGPYDPSNGHRFNVNKLLLDPYAKQLKGTFSKSDSNFSYDMTDPDGDRIDQRDNACHLPKCVVIDQQRLLASASKMKADRSSSETIIYELHVKGFTKLNQAIDTQLQGTFKGLADPSVIEYLTNLGITTVELMPVKAFVDETQLSEKGLTNYWGYNSIAFFAPEPKFCSTDDLTEFQQMVASFHQADIEVLLDVVYNHTAEGNHLGPTYSFKGLDNASYYRLEDNNPRHYINYSGCGNTLNLQHPRVLQLVMDSLRYWVEVMGVDGFRFDLAPILGRGRQGKDEYVDYSSFFAAIRQDPILSVCKLIAEPWDVGPNGYQLGNFPGNWMEWNDRYRDTVRQFWRGDQGMLPELARRLHGSNDLFSKKGRHPYSSINYITAHDGFTLEDLVSYESSHNDLNGENNVDGHGNNFSCNYGHEGYSDDTCVTQHREQQKRNLLLTLFLSQGTPMLLAGDECNHSQQGNNNAYCQDNEITWIDWNKADKAVGREQLTFVQGLIKLRKEHPLLNRKNYQHGKEISAKTGLPDLSWLNSKGDAMVHEDWVNPEEKCLGMLLADVGEKRTLSKDMFSSNQYCSVEYGNNDALLIVLNADRKDQLFCCPTLPGEWKIIVDTQYKNSLDENIQNVIKNTQIMVTAHSCVVLTYAQIDRDIQE